MGHWGWGYGALGMGAWGSHIDQCPPHARHVDLGGDEASATARNVRRMDLTSSHDQQQGTTGPSAQHGRWCCAEGIAVLCFAVQVLSCAWRVQRTWRAKYNCHADGTISGHSMAVASCQVPMQSAQGKHGLEPPWLPQFDQPVL